MRRIAIGLLVGVSVFAALLTSGVAQAGGGGGGYACQGDSNVRQTKNKGEVEIVVRDSCFGPVIANVAQGTTVRWVSAGQQPHNVVALDKQQQQSNMLQSSGSSLAMTLDRPGAFIYYCSMHPGMVGTVFVTGEGDEAEIQPVSAAAASDAATEHFTSMLPPSAAASTLTTDDGSDGVPVFSVLLLALIVGTVAGGGSTLLVRQLDQH